MRLPWRCSIAHRLVAFGQPKTAGGEDRTVELDRGTVALPVPNTGGFQSSALGWASSSSEVAALFLL